MLTAVMFLVSFAWSFVYVALPFHIEHISPVGPAATLAWTGWILGVTSLGSVVSTPVWSRYAARGDPKAACVWVQALQALGFLATGLAGSLPELFLARLALGVIGSASTFAFILAGRTRDPVELRRRLGTVQSAMMVGQVLGPLPGAVVAARLGFRHTFFLGGLMLAGCAGLMQWGMPRPPEPAGVVAAGRRMPVRYVVVAATLVLVASTQESFLAAVLPRVLPGLGVTAEHTVEAGGMLLFVSGLAAALGGLAAPYLAEQVGERRLLPALLVGSSVVLLAFGVAGSVGGFTVLRILQSLAIAPLFPLVVARVARHGGGDAIGIVNAARVGANFVGAVFATSVLTWAPPALLYALLGLAGLASAVLLRLERRRSLAGEGSAGTVGRESRASRHGTGGES